LIETFLELDKLMKSEAGKTELKSIYNSTSDHLTPLDDSKQTQEIAELAGTTACVALITRTEIYVANAGDSRAIISKSGSAHNMSEDHKPELKTEKDRIVAAGGRVEDNRIDGSLGLSRALGDFKYKSNTKLPANQQLVIATPDVTVEKITPDCEMLIMACDGIWECKDVMSSQNIVDFVKEQLAKNKFKPNPKFKLSGIIEILFEKLITRDIQSIQLGGDNMSCIIIRFKHT